MPSQIYNMSSSKMRLMPLGLLTGIALFIFFLFPVIFEGASLIPSNRGPWIDPAPPLWINWATAKIIQNAILSGQIPIWTDLVGIGVPLLADPHTSYLSPFSFILYLLPNSYGWDILVIAKASLAIILTCARAMRLGFNAWMGMWGALLFTFSGHVYQFLHHFHTNSLVFAPLCLVALIDLLESNYRRGIFLAGIGLPLMVFGGGLLDLVLLALAICMMSVWYILLVKSVPRLSYTQRATKLAIVAFIFILSVAVAAVWIIPYVELRQISVEPRPGRSHAVYDNLWYAFGLFIKNSMDTNIQYSHWFMRELQYLSIIALPGFFVGVYTLLTKRSQYQWFYLGFLCLGILQWLKLYGFAPIQVLTEVPVLQDVRYEKYTGIATLGFYLISGFGYQSLVAGQKRRAFFIVGVATLLVLSILLAYGRIHSIEWNQQLFRYIVVVLMPGLFLVLWNSHLGRGGIVRVLLIGGASGVVFFQLIQDTDRRFSKRDELFDDSTVSAAAFEISTTKRFFVVGKRGGPRVWSGKGINDVRDISVVHVDRYHKYFKTVIEKEAGCWHMFVLCVHGADKLSLDGLRWIGVDTLIMRKKQLSMLKKNQDKGWAVVDEVGDYMLVKLDGVKSLYTLVLPNDVTLRSPTPERIIEDFASADSPVYLEGVADNQLSFEQPLTLQPEVQLLSKSGMSMNFAVRSSQPAYLLVKRQFYPGWVASVSGKPTSILRANYLFMAIPVPQGESTVSLSYRPDSVMWGIVVSTLAVLLLVGLYFVIGGFNRFGYPHRLQIRLG